MKDMKNEDKEATLCKPHQKHSLAY